MPLDLRKYDQKPDDWTWTAREEKRLGETGLSTMQNAIYNTLIKVPEEQYFDIETSVKPENHEVFVKTVCEFLAYYPDYRFNLLMNKVYHDTKITFVPQAPKGDVKKENINNETDEE